MSAAPDLDTLVRQVGGDPADLPFWRACQEGRFLLHRCALCQRSYWPASRCVEHGDAAMHWVDSPGHGTLYTYTVMHHAYSKSMKDKVPYIVGVIRLDEGPFFHSNVTGCAPEHLRIGMALQARMVAHESGLTLPDFHPA